MLGAKLADNIRKSRQISQVTNCIALSLLNALFYYLTYKKPILIFNKVKQHSQKYQLKEEKYMNKLKLKPKPAYFKTKT